MTEIKVVTRILSPIARVFDLSRRIDLHLESTARTHERAIAGVTNGLIGYGETVTWRAKHFGIYQNFTSKITQYDCPNSFTDEMQQGVFKSFKHLHLFKEEDGITIMIDKIEFKSPFGFLGKIVDKLILKSYLESFIIERNVWIKSESEKESD